MKHNELLVFEPGNQYPNPGEVAPYASLPAWWRGFIFHVLNGREFQVYMYLVMRTDANAVCFPRIKSIHTEMGLTSDTQVYSALKKLVELGFILRHRTRLPNRTSLLERNVYQRAAPEYTLLTLLKRGRIEDGGKAGDQAIDEFLQPCRCPSSIKKIEPILLTPVGRDALLGLKRFLGNRYAEYADAADEDKRSELMRILRERYELRVLKGEEKYADREPAPRDRQRRNASLREKRIAAAGGVTHKPSSSPPFDIPF